MRSCTDKEDSQMCREWLHGRSAATISERHGRSQEDIITCLGRLYEQGRLSQIARAKQINPSFYIATLKTELSKLSSRSKANMGSIHKQYTEYDQALQEHAEATRKSKTWLPPEDICESRHAGNHESREAFEQIESSRDW